MQTTSLIAALAIVLLLKNDFQCVAQEHRLNHFQHKRLINNKLNGNAQIQNFLDCDCANITCDQLSFNREEIKCKIVCCFDQNAQRRLSHGGNQNDQGQN